MKQSRVAGGTYLNYKQHDFWLPLVRDRRLRAATTASAIEGYERPLLLTCKSSDFQTNEEIIYFLHSFENGVKK
jgi:hypothetical protein